MWIEPSASSEATQISYHFLVWKSEKVYFMEISEKIKFYKWRLKWQGTPGDGKILSKYESINNKETQEERFDMDAASLLWGYFEGMCHYVIGVPG